jgi:uncharacterized protein
MSLLLLAVIQLYWRVWPRRWRRRCLFRESCSRYVYRITRREGFVAGVAALRGRVRACRPGYTAHFSERGVELSGLDGTVVQEPDVSESIVAFVRKTVRRAGHDPSQNCRCQAVGDV